MLARLHFIELIQNSQTLGVQNEHMLSSVRFNIQLPDGTVHRDALAVLKQQVGSTFDAPLEVLPPSNYSGPSLDFGKYCDVIEQVFREMIGPNAISGIKISGNCTNVVMTNNRFGLRQVKDVPLADKVRD